MALAVALLVTFSLSQSGLPLDAYGPTAPATLTGKGSLQVARPLVYLGLQTQTARVESAEITYRIGRRRIILRVEQAELTAFADGSRLLDLDVRVSRSNDPLCPRGRAGEVYLLDDADGRDEAKLLVCPPAWEHYFNPLRGRIAVVIRPHV